MSHRCVNCGDPAPLTWFCPVCTDVKEQAYAEVDAGARFAEVVAKRDAALAEFRESKLGQEESR